MLIFDGSLDIIIVRRDIVIARLRQKRGVLDISPNYYVKRIVKDEQSPVAQAPTVTKTATRTITKTVKSFVTAPKDVHSNALIC